MSLSEARLSLEVAASIDAEDIVRGLGNDDERILTFICELLAYAGSQDLRAAVLERLGVDGRPDLSTTKWMAQVDLSSWSDDDFRSFMDAAKEIPR